MVAVSYLVCLVCLLGSAACSVASTAVVNGGGFRAKLSMLVQPLRTESNDRELEPMERSKLQARRDITRLHRSEASHVHRVVFAVQQRNTEELERILHDVSNPHSANYGRYLTTEAVNALTTNPEGSARVLQFLTEQQRKHGLTTFSVVSNSRQNEYITVDGPIQHWERIFSTEFYEFTSTDDPEVRFNRADSYHLPQELVGHVSAVFNTVQLPDIRYQRLRRMQAPKPLENDAEFANMQAVSSKVKRSNQHINGLFVSNITVSGAVSDVSAAESSAGTLASKEIAGYVTPALLNRIYSIDSNSGGGLGSQAVYETIGQSFSPSDLALFQKQFGLPSQPVAEDIGGHMSNTACKNNNGNDCIEANLDVQYLMAVAQAVPTTYYYWAGDDFLLEWIQEVANMASPPLVFSISYGMDEPALPDSYGKSFDLTAMKLGVRGVTILASSGDDGAVSPNAARDSMSCGYSPSFPATSPYVTAVGGTMGPEHHTAEVVCQSDKGGIITSGGGFSAVYPTPAWQRDHVQRYLQATGTGASGTGGVAGRGAPLPGFNGGGRGYPDVSALAFNYVIAVNHNFTAVSGTSASSPVMAGMVSLVNSARIAAGKAPLGWINPVLYQLYEAFAIDVTEGANNCAAGALVCCGHGFGALPGWDPVSGLGSVNFAAFKAAFMALPDHSSAPTAAPSVTPGEPTPAPVQVPTAQPSLAPSAYPTVAKGWMALQQYSDVDCEGEVTLVSGVPLGVCLIEYDDNGRAVGSVEYNCNSVEAAVSTFSDTICKSTHLVDKQIFGIGCALSVMDSYYAEEGSAYSTSMHCELPSSGTSALVPPTPTAAVSRAYTMDSVFDSLTGCQAASLSEYTLYLDKHCFDVVDPAYGDYSYKFTFPTAYEYSKLGCVGHPQTVSLPTVCTDAGGSRRLQDNHPGTEHIERSSPRMRSPAGRVLAEGRRILSDDSSGSTALFKLWSLVHSRAVDLSTRSPTLALTQAPSVERSAMPTFKDQPTVVPTVHQTIAPSVLRTDRPTEAPVVRITNQPSVSPNSAPTLAPSEVQPVRPPFDQMVAIDVQQLIKGVSSAEFKAAGATAEKVFKHAVAKTMISVEANDVTITKLADTSVVLDPTERILSQAESVWVCVVSYTVKFSTVEAGYSSAVAAYNAVVSQLTNAIQSGQFDVYVYEYALIYQSKMMETVVTPHTSSSAVVSTSFSVVNKPPSDDSGGGGGIGPAGIAAIVVLVAVITLLVVCAIQRKHACIICGKRGNTRYAELGTESVHDTGKISPEGDGSGGYPGRTRSSLARLAAQSVIGRGLLGGSAARVISGRASASRPEMASYGTDVEDGHHHTRASEHKQQATLMDPDAAHSPTSPPEAAVQQGSPGVELSTTMYNPLSNTSV